MKGAKRSKKSGQATTSTWVIVDEVDRDPVVLSDEALELAVDVFGQEAGDEMRQDRDKRLLKKHQVG